MTWSDLFSASSNGAFFCDLHGTSHCLQHALACFVPHNKKKCPFNRHLGHLFTKMVPRGLYIDILTPLLFTKEKFWSLLSVQSVVGNHTETDFFQRRIAGMLQVPEGRSQLSTIASFLVCVFLHFFRLAPKQGALLWLATHTHRF